jgi:hypothetical protein
MIAIYKKLPKTNCGRCGEATCMAFALKVKNNQAALSDCPFAAGEIPGEQKPAPGTGPFSNFEQVSQALEKEAVMVDFRGTAEVIGGMYEIRDGAEAIRINMLYKAYELRKEGLFENGSYCRDAWARIIIYDYVRRKGARPLTGVLISLGHFPHTASHVKAFQSNAEKKISESFSTDLNSLKKRSAALGGGEIEGKVKADYHCCFQLLPHVPLYLSFWQADEEFDAACKLLFDSGSSDHIDIEYLATLVERFVEELTGD